MGKLRDPPRVEIEGAEMVALEPEAYH